jgi:cation:H+ antiporter
VSEALVTWIALFALAGGVVIAAGIVLARAGDEIATRTGLGGLLVGMLLLAVATSLPEVATNVAAALQGAPDLAVADLFGAGMANMATLAIIDLLHRGRVWPSVSIAHARLAAIAIGLTAIALLGIVSPTGMAIGWVGAETVAIVLVYVAAVAWMRRSVRTGRAEHDGTGEFMAPTGWARPEEGRYGLRTVVARFAAAALAILVAAPLLAAAGEGIAEETSLGQTVVGAGMVALATSLPELVASLAAVRIGAYDLAVGNLFGSSAFNMTVLVAADAAYTPGAILSAVAPSQAIAAIGAILLMSMALAAVVHGGRTRVVKGEPGAAAVLVVYLVVMALIVGAPR